MICSFSGNYFLLIILIRFSVFCLKVNCVLSVKKIGKRSQGTASALLSGT